MRSTRLPVNPAAAASALALVLIAVSAAFIAFMMIAVPGPSPVMKPPHSSHLLSSLGRSVSTVLVMAYATDIAAWIILFAMRRAGVQRLTNADTTVRHL